MSLIISPGHIQSAFLFCVEAACIDQGIREYLPYVAHAATYREDELLRALLDYHLPEEDAFGERERFQIGLARMANTLVKHTQEKKWHLNS